MGDSISNSSNETLTKCNGEQFNTTKSTHAASEIIGAQVGKRNGNASGSGLDSLLTNPVQLNFNFNTVANGSTYRCVYWNFSDP